MRPEKDALFFSKVAATAQSLDGYHSQTAAADFTKATVFGKLKSMLAAGKLRRYKAKGGLIMYVSSAIMDALEQSSEFTRNIVVTQVADGGTGIETRVTDIDGVPVMEVIDDEVFYDSFDFSPDGGGFEPAADNYVLTKDTAIASARPITPSPAATTPPSTAPQRRAWAPTTRRSAPTRSTS